MLEMMMDTRKEKRIAGQVLFDYQTTERSFTVPEDVELICVVAIGAGRGNAGAGLSWRNNIPVTPGEVLTVVLDVDSVLRRQGTDLIIAKGTPTNSRTGGLGGKNASSINDGGGNGGSTPAGAGNGGAGGYSGNGGAGASSGLASSGSGGGGGGGNVGRVDGQNRIGFGGGTYPYGQGTNGAGGMGGSYPAGARNYWGATGSAPPETERLHIYGGGTNIATTLGCVRIIWGDGRYFPDTNTQDV